MIRKGRAHQLIKPKKKSIQEKILNLLKANESEGVSTENLVHVLKSKIHSISARLAELEQSGQIYQHAKHKANKEVYTVWKITPPELVELRRAENWNKRFALWIGKGLKNGFLSKKELRYIDRQNVLF